MKLHNTILSVKLTKVILICLLSLVLTRISHAGINAWTNILPSSGHVFALAIDPVTPSTIYAGGENGVFKSTNGGESWTTSASLTYFTANALAIDPVTPSTIYAGGGGVFKSTDGGKSWTPINAGTIYGQINALAIDPITPSTIYAGSNGGGVFKSINGGESWTASGSLYADADVRALAIDPVTPSTIYAGSNYRYGWGVFKSTNGGDSWTPMNAGLAYFNISALAIDPVTPSTIYAASNYRYGSGVFKSTNGGESWTRNAGLTYGYIKDLAIDPVTPSTVYVGSAYGLFKSTNGGESWTASLPYTYIRGLAIDPVTPSTIYAGSNGGGVLKSTNGGESWTAKNAGLTYGYINVLAIDPVTPSTIYAGTGGYGLFKSTNGGESWTAINPGGYINFLAIDPVTPSTIYAATGGVFKSTNGGEGWVSLPVVYAIQALAIDPVTPSTIYAAGGCVSKSTDGGKSWTATSLYPCINIRALAIDPFTPSTVYVGSDECGVSKSTDGGKRWIPMNAGLYGKISALAIDPVTPSTVYAGTERGFFKLGYFFDEDTLSDEWEWQYFGDLVQGPNDDYDHDGLTNLQEYQLGTNPTSWDTDGDGVDDGDEVSRGTDPLNWDTDGDGLSDGDEVSRGTDPKNPDTDGDGVNDGTEVAQGKNPLDPNDQNIRPVANFNYSPTTPKAGEEIIFVADDMDRKIVAYEWDWNGDGDYDDYTASPTASFWWIVDGTYHVALKVIDDEGNVNVTSKEITISKSSMSKYATLAGIWNFDWLFPDNRDLESIDDWLREFEPKSRPLDWLETAQFHWLAKDVIYVLNKEIDHDLSPGETYKTMILNAIEEEKLVELAFRESCVPGYEDVMTPLIKYAMGTAWNLNIPVEAAKMLSDSIMIHVGLPIIMLALKTKDIIDLFLEANKQAYPAALGCYFWNCSLGTSTCFDDDVERLLKASIPSGKSEEKQSRFLEESKSTFQKLWEVYHENGRAAYGLYQDFKIENRNKIKDQLLSALEKYKNELPNREKRKVYSPVELRVFDSSGRITGLKDGIAREEIPNSIYDDEIEAVTIFLPGDFYRSDVVGINEGVYNFIATSLHNGSISTFTASDIPTSISATHQYNIDWTALSQGEKGVIVKIDSNGDSQFERQIISDNVLTKVEFQDTTPPIIDISGCPLKINLNMSASITINVSDNESGVAYQSEPNGTKVLDTTSVGVKTSAVTARDNSGNEGSNSCTYQVIYDFTGAGGFQPPVDDLPVTNTAKAGSSIPVKWKLPNGKGGSISDLGAVISIQFQQAACSNFSNTPTDPVETTATGGTGLRYDFTANQFVYNWQTSKTQAGKCFVLNLKLNDGSLYKANFSLK